MSSKSSQVKYHPKRWERMDRRNPRAPIRSSIPASCWLVGSSYHSRCLLRPDKNSSTTWLYLCLYRFFVILTSIVLLAAPRLYQKTHLSLFSLPFAFPFLSRSPSISPPMSDPPSGSMPSLQVTISWAWKPSKSPRRPPF